MDVKPNIHLINKKKASDQHQYDPAVVAELVFDAGIKANGNQDHGPSEEPIWEEWEGQFL